MPPVAQPGRDFGAARQHPDPLQGFHHAAGRAAGSLRRTGEGYAIFQVTGITPAHAPTFAEWKSHVLDDYRQEQLPALLNQKTQELADKAKAMNDLAKAAKAEARP